MQNLQAKLEKAHRSRSGSVYVAVLGVSLIVAVIGIASLHVARLEVREATALEDMAKARLAARSGIECALAKLKADTLWRTTYASGVANVLNGLSTLVGTGGYSFSLVDDDGNLSDDQDDLVTLRCVGTSGDARHVIELMLAPTGDGLGCLSAAMHTGGDIDVNTNLTTNQTISSNANIDCGGGNINGNAQASGSILPAGNVSGTRATGMAALQMPDPAGVFEFYMAIGTPIAYGSLSGGVIEEVVLSATNNPFGGATNQQGVYVIDCQGGNVLIRNSRILATLVLLNVGSQVEVSSSVNWEPFVANYPALMVQGNLLLNCTSQQALSESSNSTNFNPAHTPYMSQSDSTYGDGDTYPSLITGLVYSTGNLTVTNQASLTGVAVAAGTATISTNSTFNYKSLFFSNPPPGFTAGNLVEVVPGTWKQVSY